MYALSFLYISSQHSTKNSFMALFEEHFNNIILATEASTALKLFHIHHPYAIYIDADTLDIDIGVFIAMVKKNHKDIPIIIISSHSNKATLIKLIHFNFIYYFEKPIDTKILKESIKTIHSLVKHHACIHLHSDLIWKYKTSQPIYKSTEIPLINKESSLLKILIKNINTPTSLKVIMSFVYQDNPNTPVNNKLSQLISRLNKKITRIVDSPLALIQNHRNGKYSICFELYTS